MRVAHPHVDPAAAEFSRLGSFEDRIGRVLYDFEDLSVAIAAREHGLLDIEMLFNEIRLDLVHIQELSEAQKPAASAPGGALKTPWGDPDLQGIWMEETDTPLQRPARFASQEYFTPEQRAELDEVRSALAGKDQRAERGTELDVGGSYNQLFVPRKHSGVRTSMIVDPPNGRIPPMTAEAQKTAAAEREFRLALIPAKD